MPRNAIEPKSMMWNLWHGCHKLSVGCKHCYVYRGDAKRDIDSSVVAQTKNFDLPVREKRNGEYKVLSETLLYTCFTSDFFLEDADPWRGEAWELYAFAGSSSVYFLLQIYALKIISYPFFKITNRPHMFL